MINLREVVETNEMIDKENLDVRTITLGISLLDCIDSDLQRLNDRIYHKIYDAARDLVRTGEEISKEFGIPIVKKRISVTPIGLIGGAACKTKEDFVEIAKTLDRVAKDVGVNFIGGYSALVAKGMTPAEELLIDGSVPDRTNYVIRKPGFYQNRYQYGCGEADGRSNQGNGCLNKGQGFLRVYEACRSLQCTG